MAPLASINILYLMFVLASMTASTKSDLPYSSKTPYQPGDLKTISKPPGCKTVHINMVLRHGSRYPCTVTAVKIVALLKKINQVHESNVYNYKNLTFPWSLPFEYQIADNCEQSASGDQEIYHLAKQFKNKFPTLFDKKYWNEYYKFVTSGTPRTARSAAAFGYGLFEGNGTLGPNKYQPLGIVFSGPRNKDKLLRYYSTCPRYKQLVEDGKGMDEWKKFGLSDSMKTVIKNIEERLQVQGKLDLSADSVQTLFYLCAFATMNQENRDWCTLFNEKDAEVLEYYMDLDQYYSHSYGNDISYKTNCPLVADITNSLKTFVTQNQSYPYGIFRFTHSGTVTALQSILGMYNDPVPLKANNFAKQKHRKFRISRNVPMSANMAFVLYECDRKPNHMVQIVMNENPAVLPCCNNGSLCSLQTFLSCFEPIGKSCDFDAMCEIPSAGKASASSLQDRLTLKLLLVMVLLLL